MHPHHFHYKWLTADQIHNGKEFFRHRKYIKVSPQGMILDISASVPKNEYTEHYEGIICPGFINTHCHLELSHMKGKIPKNTGLPEFLRQVMTRNSETVTDEVIEQTVMHAFHKGTVAYGDISNNISTFHTKNTSAIHFHTFVESLGKSEIKAQENFSHFKKILEKFRNSQNKNHTSSLTIHSPYSVSDALYRSVNDYEGQALLSIHSQESQAETELFEKHSGPFIDFYKTMNIPIEFSGHQGKNSLHWILSQISDAHTLILVHNTFSGPEDWKIIAERPRTYMCLCPNANLYIEGTLPAIPEIAKTIHHICIGTDSLASNEDIDIFNEIRTIKESFPDIESETLIRWATYNGARALGWNTMGEIFPGNPCHLVNISKDFQTASLIV